ncbi:YetF domain-containing protein [uncultured Marivita sp.]|uniref:DUF421 domain-containing protein n=1 Tax=uncultured Marivita sp. TaxID=888080 RepID=UPI002603070A|nr:YetF domain-containing protein [uncultured Marivita sp.]
MPDDLLLSVIRGATLSALGLFWVIAMVRWVGLRSFSKMTSFDFVVTVAIGSLLAGAGQAASTSGFLQASVAISGLMGAQVVFQKIRQSASAGSEAIENEPVLLMRDGQIDEDALTATRVTRGDLLAKLREANVLRFDDVRAVVLETTGDISVLHGKALSDDLLDGVKHAV